MLKGVFDAAKAVGRTRRNSLPQIIDISQPKFVCAPNAVSAGIRFRSTTCGTGNRSRRSSVKSDPGEWCEDMDAYFPKK